MGPRVQGVSFGHTARAKQSMEEEETEAAVGCTPGSCSLCRAVPVTARGQGWGPGGPGVTGAPGLA